MKLKTWQEAFDIGKVFCHDGEKVFKLVYDPPLTYNHDIRAASDAILEQIKQAISSGACFDNKKECKKDLKGLKNG